MKRIRIYHLDICLDFWPMDYFELKAIKSQQMKKENFLELPLSDQKQKLLRNGVCHKYPPWEIYGSKDEKPT